MADNTKPIPPVPNKADILEKSPKDSKQVSVTWIRWFIQIRDKINLINESIAGLAKFTGTGFISSDGAGNFNGRTIGGTSSRISVSNGDGATGNPVVDLVDTGVTPGTYANTNLTVDESGRITNATNGSASGAPLTTKGDIFGYDTADARIPVGTDGYVLTADSTDPLGVSYKPPGTPTLPVTTKGDLLGFSTVADRVPVGSNGQVLTSDSTNSLGVSWKGSTSTLIQKIVTTASQSAVTFSSIPGTFTDLLVIFSGRDTSASVAVSPLRMILNADTTASNYTTTNYVEGFNGTASSGGLASTSAGAYIAYCPGTSSNANAIGTASISIPNYSGTIFQKIVMGTNTVVFNSGTTAGMACDVRTFRWANTAAITSITFNAGTTAFLNGTTFTLYGLG